MCDGGEEHCKCAGCPKRHCKQISIQRKEDDKMRIAIPLDENKKDVCVVFARLLIFFFRMRIRKQSWKIRRQKLRVEPGYRQPSF